MSTRSLPDGKAYRGSSLPSFCLQAKGSEHSFTTGRRVPERKSLRKRRYVRTQYSSSGPCVLNRWIEQKSEFFTTHFLAAAKVTHSRLRGGKAGLSSPPVNNFGRPIRTQRKQMGKPQKVTKKHKEQPDVTEIVMFDLPFLRPLMHSTEMVRVLAVASALVWSER